MSNILFYSCRKIPEQTLSELSKIQTLEAAKLHSVTSYCKAHSSMRAKPCCVACRKKGAYALSPPSVTGLYMVRKRHNSKVSLNSSRWKHFLQLQLSEAISSEFGHRSRNHYPEQTQSLPPIADPLSSNTLDRYILKCHTTIPATGYSPLMHYPPLEFGLGRAACF